MNWKTSYVNGLCISIILNNMRWYLAVIVNLHNNEYLMHIFTRKFENITLTIFNKKLYHSWYKELRNHFHIY